jgi:hypothetical protein
MNTQMSSPPRAVTRGGALGMAAVALAWALATAVTVATVRTPAHVDRIVVDNPHAWGVTVAVSDGEAHGWVGVGRVPRERTQTFGQVLDPGDVWTVRFAYGGVEVALRVQRAELARAGWRVVVPDELAERLQTAGVPETPR